MPVDERVFIRIVAKPYVEICVGDEFQAGLPTRSSEPKDRGLFAIHVERALADHEI